nr:ATP-binding cassette domain-containing protein [Sediminihabitans luteus]
MHLDVAPGEVVAVLGPNGAGKSTLLQAVAGVLPRSRHDDVRLVLDGAAPPSAPHRRRVAWLSQRPLLLDHLRVLDNVAFGPRARGASRREARAAAREALVAVGAEHLTDRRPGALSGGQAQRVAIARALATDPRVVLLDEPLASLDVEVAQAVRATLQAAQAARPRTTLLVTHDLLDVLLLADRAVVLDHGRVVEDAPARELLTRPRSAFAARLAGVNLLTGTATEPTSPTRPTSPTGPTSPTAERNVAHAETTDLVQNVAFGRGSGGRAGGGGGTLVGTGRVDDGAPAVAVFSPAAVAVHRERPHGSPRNVLPVRVVALEPHLSLVRVRAELVHDETIAPSDVAGPATTVPADAVGPATTSPADAAGPATTVPADAVGPVPSAPRAPSDATPQEAAPQDPAPQDPAPQHPAPSLAADLTPAAVADLGLAPGDRVWFVVKAAEVQVYPA